jgi:hypothetical protein
VSRDFCLWFFSWISFPPAPEYPIRTVWNFFENSWIRKSRCTTGINDTGGKFATGINDTSTKDNGSKFATGVNNTGGKQWEQLSDCWQLKMNLKKKIYLYDNSTTQRCPKEIKRKFFWFKIFSICHPCQWHRWCILSCEYLNKFTNKFETALIGGLGETDLCRETEDENLMALSL